MSNLTPALTVANDMGGAGRPAPASPAPATRTGPRDPDRRDPVAILAAQNQQRLSWLVPMRHSRMGVSPFTFYRGAAAIMAEDLGWDDR